MRRMLLRAAGRALRLAALGWMTAATAAPARASDWELTEDLSFGSDAGPSERDRAWQFSLGAGMSILPNYEVYFPPVIGSFQTQVDNETDYLVFLVPTEPNRKEVGSAVMFEASLLRRLAPFLQAGLAGGMSTTHKAKLTPGEAFGDPSLDDEDLLFPFDLHYNVNINKAIGLLDLGVWMGEGRLQFRPFLTAGGGWYQIKEALLVRVNQYNNTVFSRSHGYSGAMAGAGLSWSFIEQGVLTLEGRYERIFAPGPALELFTPALRFGYLF